ncbi:uncharacterized protein [Nicotiana sylvestris]|uniref:uncharacterized protein isoform X3 n=1 Tax=Nicotiana sylvestris TaxID=4096 RepID=UPI00388C48B0
MSGLFVGILCITKRGFQLRSFDSLSSSASSQKEQRISVGSHGYKNEELGEKAREAKQRLDHKLRREDRVKVCVHTTIARLHLWDYTEDDGFPLGRCRNLH